MVSVPDIDHGILPTPLRIGGLVALGLLLTALFAVWIFPYPRLARALSERSEGLVGIRLELGELGPTVGLSGIGVEARQVRATLPRGETLVVPRVFLRPALSIAWLRGDPSFAVDIDGGGLGRLGGTLTLGARGGWDGTLDKVALSLLPLEQVVAGLSMEGTLSGDIDVATDGEGRPVGDVAFEATDGSLLAPGLPVAIPFTSFRGNLDLGDEQFARVHELVLDGPMLYASATGTVAKSDVRGAEPLDLVLELRPIGRGLEPTLRNLGIDVRPGQTTQLQITGTLGRPTFR